MRRTLTTLTAAIMLAAVVTPAQAVEIGKPGCIYTKVGLAEPLVYVECQGKVVDILDARSRKPLKKVLLQGKYAAKLCWVLPRTKRLLCA